MKKVTIYTDGACSGNPGPGGWGSVLMFEGHEKELSGYEPQTTNNRMELLAVIEGMRAMKEPCDIAVYSDSKYVVDAFKKDWISGWLARDWKNSQKKPVKNRDLWEALLEQVDFHSSIEWNWVKGHAGDPNNERADRLATGAIDKFG